IALGGLAGIGYVVAGQLDHLAGDLSNPAKRELIQKKVRVLRLRPESNLSKVQNTLKDVANTIDPKAEKHEAGAKGGVEDLAGERNLTGEKIQQVEVVSAPSFRERLQNA